MENSKKVVYMSVFSLIVLVLSIYNVNGVDYSFNVNFGGNIINTEGEDDLSLSSNLEKKLLKKINKEMLFYLCIFRMEELCRLIKLQTGV